MRKEKSKIILILFLCTALIAQGQDKYQWQSKLSATVGEGFYRVLLGPDITARSEAGHQDLRVVDSAGHYVPYLIKSEVPLTQVQDFQPLGFSTHTDSLFTIQIENPSGRQYKEVWLTLRNKSLSNDAFLSGSDDGQKWYDISNDIVIYPSREMAADTFEQRISFSPVKYHHLRLSMRKTKFIPVNVVRVGIYESLTTGGRYSAVPAPKITQKDSGKMSYVVLKYDDAYRLDRLMLDIAGPRLYHRAITVYSRDSLDRSYLGQYTVSSAGNNIIDLSVKTSTLLIEIDNQDNPPLEVKSAEAMQLNRYAVMYLNGDRSYFLVFGNAKAERPNYDIGYFEDSLHVHAPIDLIPSPITANSIIPNAEPATIHAEPQGLKKYWIWPVLIGVLGILLFFTLRMGREIGKK